MTLHLGYIPASSTIYIPFHTFDSNGASITLTGLAVTDIEIYKNGSVTQRSSDAGYVLLDTDGIDFDGITGLHGISIDLSDNTDAGFYAAGNFYMVAVASVTVDTRTVNFWAATFFIGPVAANVTQWLGTAAATPTVAGVPEVDVTLLNGVSQSLLDLVDFADAGYEPGTNGVKVESLNAQAQADVEAIVDAQIQANRLHELMVDSLSSQPVAGSLFADLTGDDGGTQRFTANALELAPTGGLDAAGVRAAVGLASANLDTQIGDLPTNAELATSQAAADDATLAAIAALNNLSAAQVNAEVVDALTVDVLADSVATDGTRPTIGQALLELTRFLMERSVSSTTMTVKKEDGSTTSMTFTLNDATTPTAITRAS